MPRNTGLSKHSTDPNSNISPSFQLELLILGSEYLNILSYTSYLPKNFSIFFPVKNPDIVYYNSVLKTRLENEDFFDPAVILTEVEDNSKLKANRVG